MGCTNQIQKLHKSSKLKIEDMDWFLHTDNQSIKVLIKNNLISGREISLSSKLMLMGIDIFALCNVNTIGDQRYLYILSSSWKARVLMVIAGCLNELNALLSVKHKDMSWL